MHILNTFVPTIEVLERHVGEPVWVADEKMEIRLVEFDRCYQVWVVPLANAGKKAAVSIFRFNLFDQQGPNGLSRREFLHALLESHAAVSDIHNKASKLPWKRDEGGRWAAIHFAAQSMSVEREDRSGRDVFSPFLRQSPLKGRPDVWTKADVVRALVNGQFEDLRVLLAKDANARAVVESADSLKLAWALIERFPGEWGIMSAAEKVQVCCPHGRWWSSFTPMISA